MLDIRAQENKSIMAQAHKRIYIYSLMSCALMLASCAVQQQYGTAGTLFVKDVDMYQAMEMVEDILSKMHFTIDKADAESGFIRTRPLPGAQLFEFWRSDNVGADNCLQANLHSIRRIAEVTISEQDENLNISCYVQIYRLSLPEHQVSSSARAYGMFSPSRPSLQRIQLNPEQKADMAWIDAGGDKQLAAEILKRISSILDARYLASSIE